jgi:hypothetical protein
MLSAHATRTAAALGNELTESEASLRVFMTAGGLAVLGLALLLFTIWWWRGTKPEPPALGPLEVMSDRRWHASSDGRRRRMVDQHRPAGSAALEAQVPPVPIDLSVLARDTPSGFDDLRDEPSRWPFAAVESSPLSRYSQNGSEPVSPSSFDETMDQVESPLSTPSNGQLATPAAPRDDDSEFGHYAAADGDHDDPHGETLEGEHPGEHQGEPSEEMVIDPLLQRTASQD